MANIDDQWLKEDGYLNVDTESSSIVYHPLLNVILLIASNGELKLLDVNSGVILQTYRISDTSAVRCRYLPTQDKILIWNGRNISMRGDYNGVLLLDTILQAPITQTDDRVRLELLLSEAVLFLQCLQNLEQHGLENMSDVTNELMQKICETQAHSRRGIKAQKWETVCLELPHSSLRMVASGVVMQLKRLDRHVPAMAIASAINERLTDLLEGARVSAKATNNVQRFQMYSEAARRQTFEEWPHMDYKWVLPDQMAQAGFYHQPGENGNKDRAMCFTCTVCLVCWEKTDEPWSEHERHSPECPFVKGEFTQNVPLAVTYATSPAVATEGFALVSAGDRGTVFCTGNPAGDITLWNIERQLTKVHELQVRLHPDILTTTTISPQAAINGIELTALATYFVRSPLGSGALLLRRASLSLKPKMLGTKIVAAVRVNSTEPLDEEEAEQEIPRTDEKPHEPETTLLLIVYNIEDPVVDDESGTVSPTVCPKTFFGVGGLVGGGGNNVKKSNLTTILESVEDERMKHSTERMMLQELIQAEHDILNSKKKLHAVAVGGGGGESGAAECDSDNDSVIMALPSTSLTDALDATAGSATPANGTFAAATKGTGGGEGGADNGSGDGGDGVADELGICCVPLQYIELPPAFVDSHDRYYISDTVPSSDNRFLLVVLKLNADTCFEEREEDRADSVSRWHAILYLYFLNEDGLVRGDDPLVKCLERDQSPLEITMLPKCDGTGRHFGGPETEQGIFVMTCADGKLRIVSLKTLSILSEASVKDDQFVSATYCKSLERLCGCTVKGCLHFYSFYDLDADSSDERDEEILASIPAATAGRVGDELSGDQHGTAGGTSKAGYGDGVTTVDGRVAGAATMADYDKSTTGGASSTGYASSGGASNPTAAAAGAKSVSGAGDHQHSSTTYGGGACLQWLLAFRKDAGDIENLKVLHSLTLFSEMLTPYSAEMPACWSELEQAQKQRRHPQHLRPGDDTHLTKTWRLHNDAATWDEHLIELNLPKCTSLGHIDFKFTLYQPCANSPAIQVTLLKQKSMGLCTRRKTQSINRVDESINFNIGADFIENPVLSEEYLQARNAEIVVGPIELASCMDLSEQGGCVTLISPKLLKSKGRNYLLHIKTMTDLSKDGQSKTRVPVRKKGITSILLTSFANISAHNAHATGGGGVGGGGGGGSGVCSGTGAVGKDGSVSFFTDTAGGSSVNGKTRKNDFYIGCDWLNEISITVRATSQVAKLENERFQRQAMLDSNALLENLLKMLNQHHDHLESASTADGGNTEGIVEESAADTVRAGPRVLGENTVMMRQHLALDILIWIVTIRLMRYRYPKNPFAKRANPTEVRDVASPDLNVQQTECVQIIERYLEPAIRHCIVLANRSIAHKCVKFLSLALDGAQNMVDKNACSSFEQSLHLAIEACLPEVVNSNHSGALRWFALLISGTTSSENHRSVANRCLWLLKTVAEELRNRNNPLVALLRTRFGLHGAPFDSEVFDAHPLEARYGAGACGGAAFATFSCAAGAGAGGGIGVNSASSNGPCPAGGGCTANKGTGTGGGTGSLLAAGGGPSAIDLRLLCFADGAELRCLPDQLRSRGIGTHFMGLLEVQPLHYACSATSDATRVENIDANGHTITTTANATGSANSTTMNGFGGGGSSGNGGTASNNAVSSSAAANILIDEYSLEKVEIPPNGDSPGGFIYVTKGGGGQHGGTGSGVGSQIIFSSLPPPPASNSLGSAMPKTLKIFLGDDEKENIDDDMMNNMKNVLVDKIFYSALKKHKMKSASNTAASSTVLVTKNAPFIDVGVLDEKLPELQFISTVETAPSSPDPAAGISISEIIDQDLLGASGGIGIEGDGDMGTISPVPHSTASGGAPRSKVVSFTSATACHHVDTLEPHASSSSASPSSSSGNKIKKQFEAVVEEESNATPTSDTPANDASPAAAVALPWHKLLSSPPKQVIVVERMHSGAIRYVTLDFGAPVMLTDVIIPACADLASLSLDIWCFEEEADSVRLAVSQDIQARTLVLSDLQPPPICRYLKITITGRYGMSATRCRIPMGSFYGHIVILEREAYADPVMKCLQGKKTNLVCQLQILKALYDDVHCRYCLASNKLMDLLIPYLNSNASNIAHMQAFLNRIRDNASCSHHGDSYGWSGGAYGAGGGSSSSHEYAKVTAAYDECIGFQHQLNVIRRVIDRIRPSIGPEHEPLLAQLSLPTQPAPLQLPGSDFSSIYTDKLRIISECLIEVVLQLITTYGSQTSAAGAGGDTQQQQQQQKIDQEMCNLLFDTMVIAGEAHLQLATCSMLVRMCCFEPWWGDFLADKFLTLYSSQNDRIFPQDRVFLLLTYLGRRSIALGRCRTTVIDAVLRSLATLLAPLATTGASGLSIWCNTDLNLLGWILLFLSVCLDDGSEGRKDQSNLRWDFMSGETDMVKARMNINNSGLRTLTRTFKKRLLQSNKQYNALSVSTASKLEMALKQQENQLKKLTVSMKQSFGDYFNEISKMKVIEEKPIPPLPSANEQLSSSFIMAPIVTASGGSSVNVSTSTVTTGASASGTSSSAPAVSKRTAKFIDVAAERLSKESSHDVGAMGGNDGTGSDGDTPFDRGLKAMKIGNIIVVIRGLIGLLLSMDFTCNMDLFLITCKIIARLVMACRPSMQLSKIITTNQLLQLVRIAVWENPHQPWAVHAITCLLQDVLEADKSFKDEENDSSESSGDEAMNGNGTASNPLAAGGAFLPAMRPPVEVPSYKQQQQHPLSTSHHVTVDLSYADAVKNQLPSVVECDDQEMEEMVIDDILSTREKRFLKRDSSAFSSSAGKLTFTNKTVSSAMDARLEMGLDTNVEIVLRRLTTRAAFNLISSHVAMMHEPSGQATSSQPLDSLPPWPEPIVEAWSGPEYLQGFETNAMLTEVFDKILSDLPQIDSWLNLEKVLQLWLTLNGETLEHLPGSSGAGLNPYSFPKIPFGDRAVHGLIKALATHPSVKLRAWCLGFQCLILACKPHFEADCLETNSTSSDNHFRRMGNLIVRDELFETMLLRFFSGEDLPLGTVDSGNNRYAGPTVCKLLMELFIWLEVRCHVKDQLKLALMKVTLNLVQFSGAIFKQKGPIDAQSQLIKELLNFTYDKEDHGMAVSFVECVSHLVYDSIVNVDKLYCQKAVEMNNSSSMFGGGMRFGNLFASVLGTENGRAGKTVTDGTLLVDMLKLSSMLVNVKNQRPTSNEPTPPPPSSSGVDSSFYQEMYELFETPSADGTSSGSVVGFDNLNTSSESQTDEIKAEQQSTGGGAPTSSQAPRVRCFADTVLQHQPTMTRLLTALSQCTHSSLTMLLSSSAIYGEGVGSSGAGGVGAAGKSGRNTLPELCTVADALFQLLLYLSRTASQHELVVKPLFEFLSEATSAVRHAMPKLHLYEPFLWYILKVLETPAAVAVFTDLGGIQVLCESLVWSNRALINTQPSLVSMIMQRLSKSSTGPGGSGSGYFSMGGGGGGASGVGVSGSGSSSKKSAPIVPTARNEEGLINFAPYCTITTDNQSAQAADVLIQTPIASHRRARNPAWSYLFYPNEPHVDLTITLPTAVLLKEVQLQPHLSTLASCPSAVAIEITRDSILGPIPITQPISTVGMTCIRLRFAQPEIATSVIIRLYRPRDAMNIGLTQIAILGTTTFGEVPLGGGMASAGSNGAGTGALGVWDYGALGTGGGLKPSNDMFGGGAAAVAAAAAASSGGFGSYDGFAAGGVDDRIGGGVPASRASLGWLRVLTQCFSVTIYYCDHQLASRVIGAASEVGGFMEACCALLNIAPNSPNDTLQNLETVLLKLGLHSREFGLALINNLLRQSIPQTFQLCNDSISDLLYQLCTIQNDYTGDRLQAMLEWIRTLYERYRQNDAVNRRLALHATNPYSGFIRCLAAILWQVYATDLLPNLSDMITRDLFAVLYGWARDLDYDGPLKRAIDALLCSVCCVRPEFFTVLLRRLGVLVPNLSTDLTASISDDRKDGERRTDDSKQEESDTSEWYSHLVIENIERLNLSRTQLSTIAMACQSPLAVQQLIDSGLPKLLISVVLEFCRRARESLQSRQRWCGGGSSAHVRPEKVQRNSSASATTTPDGCLTDADKWGEGEAAAGTETKGSAVQSYPMVNIHKVTEILAFFTTVCSEGHMRDWLGSYEGSKFWEPLLMLLCNSQMANVTRTITTQSCLELEECFIKFLSRVTTCHPANQEMFTISLIAVIRKSDPKANLPEGESGSTADATVEGPSSSASASSSILPRSCISGFTRRLVLQILLESEKIMVAVRSDLPLQQSKDIVGPGGTGAAGGESLYNAISNHPSKRPNAHLKLFQLSTNAKCQDILDHCAATVYQPLLTTVVPPAAVPTTVGGNVAAGGPVPAASVSSSVAGVASELSMLGAGGSAAVTAQPITAATSSGGSSGSSGGAAASDGARRDLWELGIGLEYLSVAAGVTAKDKRLKEAKNQAATMRRKDVITMYKLKMHDSKISAQDGMFLTHTSVPEVIITTDTTVAQLLTMLKSAGISLSTPCINLNLIDTKNKPPSTETCCGDPSVASSSAGGAAPAMVRATEFLPQASPLQIFSSRGGLSLLAHYLPTVYPEMPKSSSHYADKDRSPAGGGGGAIGSEWVKLEQMDEIYEDLDDITAESTPKAQCISAIPQHSLAAFALFLKLPAYSEVLLTDTVRAQCLLRLILGVTGDGEGNEIYSLALSSSLPTLPFEVFRQLLDSSPLTTDDGVLLRRMVIEVGAIHLVLNCLSIFTHHNSTGGRVSGSGTADNSPVTGLCAGVTAANGANQGKPAATGAAGNGNEEQLNSDDKGHMYWAKGTGFGTGSTQQSWNVEQALLRQKSEEEHVTVLLQVLSSYINPGDKYPTSLGSDDHLNFRDCSESLTELPPIFLDLLQQSCLIPALSYYLRNDSVLDITRHIPLYRAILQLLRAVSLSSQLATLLVNKNANESKMSIAGLLSNMKACVDTYASRLKVNKKSNLKGQTQKIIVSLDDGDDEGLALLIPDIQDTSLLVQNATNTDTASVVDEEEKQTIARPLAKSVEEKYMEIMKALQFDTYEMIAESENGYRFTISHHFETNVRMAGDRGHPGRVKRLAQETVTLSTSLPLSYSSSVFVRCDTDRLDIMKVLITGPAETPYANGCFEFDVYFPPDYPNSPMMINLETTGRNTVRFNPNLYNDGKVCLSVLNTWHGRPEEKWNAHTSSFLQVLVSIQSLILVPEPYFNEPGFERSRGTPTGTHSSREYNSNIYQACVRFAMLEQLRHPCPAFRDVIHTHFWLKRNEICVQIEEWIAELSNTLQNERTGRAISFNVMVLRRQYRQLREELAKLTPPEGLEDADYPFRAGNTSYTTPPATPASGGDVVTSTNAVSTMVATTASILSTSAYGGFPPCISSSSSTSSSSSSSSTSSSTSSSSSASSSASHTASASTHIPPAADGANENSAGTEDSSNETNSFADPSTVTVLRGGSDVDFPNEMLEDAITVAVAADFCVHSKDAETDLGTVTTATPISGADCSESSSASSSVVSGVSGSGDSSESTAVTGGLSEETNGSNLLPAGTGDDISSITSAHEKPTIGSSVHESLDDDGDLSLDEMAV